MPCRFLTALPIFNEKNHVQSVLSKVRQTSEFILVVDDGSTDGSTELLEQEDNLLLVTHPRNLGYGAALRTAFQYAIDEKYDFLVTIDCDGQHEPQRIPQFIEACQQVDIVSGSRYLETFAEDGLPPEQRKQINQEILADLQGTLGLELTDAFCGFKAYRVSALQQLRITESGYAMPLELWVQAVHLQLNIREIAVPLIYLDECRSFGSVMDDGNTRLAYYRRVIRESMLAVEAASSPPSGQDHENQEGTR
jgi:glycosyltransferase involved in cell wall biosynthesis